MKVEGECGSKNRYAVRRVQCALARIRTVARHLPTCSEKDDRRTFQGQPSVKLKPLHFGAARAAKHQSGQGEVLERQSLVRSQMLLRAQLDLHTPPSQRNAWAQAVPQNRLMVHLRFARWWRGGCCTATAPAKQLAAQHSSSHSDVSRTSGFCHAASPKAHAVGGRTCNGGCKRTQHHSHSRIRRSAQERSLSLLVSLSLFPCVSLYLSLSVFLSVSLSVCLSLSLCLPLALCASRSRLVLVSSVRCPCGVPSVPFCAPLCVPFFLCVCVPSFVL